MVVTYEVTVYTGDATHSSCFHDVFITLCGEHGDSEENKLSSTFPYFHIDSVNCDKPLGRVCLIILRKEHHVWWPNTKWFLAKVEVKSPLGEIYQFPIYRWINDCEDHYFPEGSAILGERRRKQVPNKLIKISIYESLPLDANFSYTKEAEMAFTAVEAILAKIFSVFSDYVHDHWKEDSFFGYQFLNGLNPMVIQRCQTLPDNFPVTDKMVFKDGKQSLKEEMKNGNIFLCDYKMLDGVKANIIDGKQQYLVAPLVLLHRTPDDKLMPVAIQLKQTPGKDNPIFLPSDSEWDWLLAKTFVKNADFNLHELSVHLLRTHLLAEVFSVALLRNLPMMHPLYKLLVPHTRYTEMINFMARKYLISEEGVFTKFASSGGEGMFTILQRALSSVTYRSLCLPDDLSDRGLMDVPNFFYRDDGLKLWSIINRFQTRVLTFYYKSDKMVKEDQTLKMWISDIHAHGFNNNIKHMPSKMETVDELVKFVTMVIFTCSAQHSAINTGQYDFIGWMPNTPVSLERPPPSRKGNATEATLLDTFPAINTTVQGMAAVWLLSKRSSDSVYLGNYPEQRFVEDTPLQEIKRFKEQLKKLSQAINERNKHLDLPYTYLDPKVVENSVSL
uniref:Arachidonate 15-lipoxygenase B-like n=1 Tax=Cyprinodon variegatus TaxID=28743 RepID=A0A3Q2FNA9_CYPVA